MSGSRGRTHAASRTVASVLCCVGGGKRRNANVKRGASVERRYGFGEGKSSEGRQPHECYRHETRPGRVGEEQDVKRVRNPEGGTYRVRQARVEWTLLPSCAVGGTNLMRGTAKLQHTLAVGCRRSCSVGGMTPRVDPAPATRGRGGRSPTGRPRDLRTAG
jgi:hypothetical protein